MRAAARWTCIFGAGLAVGYALVASGRVDRFFTGDVVAAVAAIDPAPVEADPPLPGPDWARVIAGAPSRAPRLLVDIEPLPEPWTPPDEPEPAVDEAPASPEPFGSPAPPPPTIARRRVEPGLTLSEILLEHYGRQGPKLAAAVARYNGLADPDAVRAGRELELPPLEALAPLMGAR